MTLDYSKLKSILEIIPLRFEAKTLRRNAALAEGVGLEPLVTRVYTGVGLSGNRTCEWCVAREGVNIPRKEAEEKGMFERHPGCKCQIDYTIGEETQRQVDGEFRAWQFVQDLNAIARREKFFPSRK